MFTASNQIQKYVVCLRRVILAAMQIIILLDYLLLTCVFRANLWHGIGFVMYLDSGILSIHFGDGEIELCNKCITMWCRLSTKSQYMYIE